ncbi:hypothetical protein [Streptomyces olivaceiscleroticus]|uniref:TolA protein n=1 Tax=Streptomyces olivaceiscleroticus TaxID=68245 RepID=A0ABN0ZP68_9ACTN
MELLLLIAIAYAGARGVEKLTHADRRQPAAEEAEETVAKVAASGPKDGTTKEPGPTDPGGTFSSAAPRSAALGGKAAVPLAVIAETGATMWRAVGEGYRERWPEIRKAHRQKMAERAAKRRTEKDAAKAEKEAEDALAKAGPPPAYPPPPTEPPTIGAGPEATKEAGEGAEKEGATDSEPRSPDAARADAAEARAEQAHKEAAEARKDAEEARSRAATEKVLAAQRETREAKERAAAAEERARAAEARATETTTDPETPTGRRHLKAVPDEATAGGAMPPAPSTLIPEIRTLDGLMNALILVRAMCEMRAEEAEAIAADDLALSNRLDQIEADLDAEEVDAETLAEIATLRESIHTQSKAAAQYGAAAKDSGDFAVAAAQAAHKSHGGIAEAVQSAPIEKAAKAGYYDH